MRGKPPTQSYNRLSPKQMLALGMATTAWILSLAYTGAFAGPGVPLPQPAVASEPGKLSEAVIEVPTTVKQGEVLKIHVNDQHYLVRNSTPSSGSVSFAGRTAKFFQHEDETFTALVPVSVFQKPGAYTLKIMDPNGPVISTRTVNVVDGKYRTQNVNVSSSTAGLQPLPGELEAIQALKEVLTPTKYWDDSFITPTPDCQNSPFGVKRFHNGKATGDYHKGVDLRSPTGRPVKAINGGTVKIAKMYRLHGGTVGLDHGQGISSVYIHMSKVAAKPGQQVKKGDVIGYVGSTGFATGPHLHWGMYVSGLPVNPNQWIKGVPLCR